VLDGAVVVLDGVALGRMVAADPSLRLETNEDTA
jgi:hypothetical protein